jgi:hypothetical protein
MIMVDQTPDEEEAVKNRIREMADRPHYWTILLSTVAIVVSILSAIVSMYSAHFAELQYNLAAQVRVDSVEAAKRQKKALDEAAQGVKDSADALKNVADAARETASAARNSAAISKIMADTAVSALHLGQRPDLQLVSARYDPRAYEVVATIVNRGKSTALSVTWQCFALPLEQTGFGKRDGPTHTSPFDAPTDIPFIVSGFLSWSPEFKGNKYFRVECEIRYWDQFSHKEPHQLNLCFETLVIPDATDSMQNCGMKSQ